MIALKEVFRVHDHAVKSGLTATIFSCNQLITQYSKHGKLQDARKVFDEMPERNVFTWNAIISAHIKSHHLPEAQSLFNAAPRRDSVTYNSMLSGYVNNDGHENRAFELFLELHRGDEAKVDEFTLTTMLNLTAKLCVSSYGKQLHALMVKTANSLSRFSVSSLIDMYSKCGCFQEACTAFGGASDGVLDLVSKNAMVAACCREGNMKMAQNLFSSKPELNDSVTYNTMISGYAQNGYEEEAIAVFKSMPEHGCQWSEHTFASILRACSSLKQISVVKEIHAWVLKKWLDLNSFISSGIVDVYCKCGNTRYAKSFVDSKSGMKNVYSVTSLIVGYSSQGDMVEARKLFDTLTDKNHVVWTAMISGYVKSNQCDEVFELFNEFIYKESLVLDPLILVSVLGACGIRAAVDHGKQIHGFVLRNLTELDEKLSSAIVDMYAKCGDITYAETHFKKVLDKDLVLYNVMLAGYAHHGYEHKAFTLFKEMKEYNIRPDNVTFIAILSACRHCGSVELGEEFFDEMRTKYSLIPEFDHYACMVDLYCRRNELEKALGFMEKIPVELDGVIIGTFLNACKVNGDVAFARKAEEMLLRIEGENGGRYIQLANLYAGEGKWEDVGRIRKKMKGKYVKKLAGCSWVHVGNKVHAFVSGDSSHEESEGIFGIIDCLSAEINEIRLGFVLQD